MTDEAINELKKFTKLIYSSDTVLNSLENLKYSNSIKSFLNRQLDTPDDELIKCIGKEIYGGRLTQAKINDLKTIFKNTFKNFINDFARKKFESVLDDSKNHIEENKEIETQEEIEENKIVTTDTELEAFYIIKSILRKKLKLVE